MFYSMFECKKWLKIGKTPQKAGFNHLAQRKGFAPLRRAPVHTAPWCAVCARTPCLFSPLRKPLALACASPIKSLSVLYSPPNKKPAKAGFLFGAEKGI